MINIDLTEKEIYENANKQLEWTQDCVELQAGSGPSAVCSCPGIVYALPKDRQWDSDIFDRLGVRKHKYHTQGFKLRYRCDMVLYIRYARYVQGWSKEISFLWMDKYTNNSFKHL